MQPRYSGIKELINLIDEPNRSKCHQIFDENANMFRTAPGSRHNHQAWEGGYCDHVRETMMFGKELFTMYCNMRILPCSMSDVMLVLFLHDLEKPWRYWYVDGVLQINPELETKAARKAFREAAILQYGIILTEDHLNALEFAESEGNSYSPHERKMGVLGTICNMADLASARIFHDYPTHGGKGDEWKGAMRDKDFK